MSNPECPKKSPYVVELEPGTYWWCACGKSKNQPFCDGSHAGTDFSPLEFTVDEKKKYGLCGCKHTQTPPMCDATHRKLD